MITCIIIGSNNENLTSHLESICDVAEPIQILASLQTTTESVTWLSNNTHPDLIFAEEKLKDGFTYLIFEKVIIMAPVIFISDAAPNADNPFKGNCIQYLQKQFSRSELTSALLGFQNLKKGFLNTRDAFIKNPVQKQNEEGRILGKFGNTVHSILLSEVLYFQLDSAAVTLTSRNGKKYIVEMTFKILQQNLPAGMFYRANNNIIFNINFLKSFKKDA